MPHNVAMQGKGYELSDRQWERLAYGFAASVLQQGIDNGAHGDAEGDLGEWLPDNFDPHLDLSEDDLRIFNEEFGVRLGKIVSDLEEESAKRDG